jgi:hypothetical protein
MIKDCYDVFAVLHFSVFLVGTMFDLRETGQSHTEQSGNFY